MPGFLFTSRSSWQQLPLARQAGILRAICSSSQGKAEPSKHKQRVACIVQYQGSSFHGWERKPHLQTVQGTIEAALHSICGYYIKTTAASKTDAGTHALGQVIHFDVPNLFLHAKLVLKVCTPVSICKTASNSVQCLPLSCAFLCGVCTSPELNSQIFIPWTMNYYYEVV